MYAKNKAIEWDSECEEAFQKLKEMCTSSPTLAFGDFMKPLKLHTDACILGFGAILYQNQDRTHKVMGYVSRSLSRTVCKY